MLLHVVSNYSGSSEIYHGHFFCFHVSCGPQPGRLVSSGDLLWSGCRRFPLFTVLVHHILGTRTIMIGFLASPVARVQPQGQGSMIRGSLLRLESGAGNLKTWGLWGTFWKHDVGLLQSPGLPNQRHSQCCPQQTRWRDMSVLPQRQRPAPQPSRLFSEAQ